MLSADSRECCDPSRIRVVSSANCVNFMFSSPIMTPVIFGSILMSIERTSAPIRNKYGDNGSPCLHPLLTEISSDKKPHCSIYAFISVKHFHPFYEIFIKAKHFKNFV